MRQCSVKLNKRECVNKCKRANKGQKQICSVFQNVSQSIKEHAHIAFPGVTVNIIAEYFSVNYCHGTAKFE